MRPRSKWVALPSVRVFDEVDADKAQALKVVEEACESFDEKDIEYITTLSHGQLEKMRKLDELTKFQHCRDAGVIGVGRSIAGMHAA